MAASERTFQVSTDKFHHEISTKLGQVYAAFLLYQFCIKVKGKVRNMPTVNQQKTPFEAGAQQLKKSIADTVYLLRTKAEGERKYRNSILQVEHQQRNDPELHYRMLNYYNGFSQEYKKKYHIVQIVVYTGDYKFNSPTELTCDINTNGYRVVDLTQLEPTEFTTHPHFGIQFLCIFSRKMSKQDKVRFLVERFKAFFKKYGRAEAQFYIDLLPLAMTKHNASAIDAITAELSLEAEFEEMIRHTAYYKKGSKEGREEGRIMSAVKIIRNGIYSIEAISEILQLTTEEIAAVQAILQQSSNGNSNHSNGNGAH